MDALKQFWAERAPRERAILLAGGVLLALVIVYLVLIEPAWTGIARLEKSLPQQRANAAELEALLAEVKALKAKPAVATMSAADARGALEGSLTRAGLKATRIVPLSDGDIQLTFSDVPAQSANSGRARPPSRSPAATPHRATSMSTLPCGWRGSERHRCARCCSPSPRWSRCC
jgi:general secretion pathway protein M